MILRLPNSSISDEDFFTFCQINELWCFERSAQGEISARPINGGLDGLRSTEVTRQLGNWARLQRAGIVTAALTGFALSNTAVRAPTAAWVRRERLAQLTAEQKRKFLPLCPDFVVELVSPSEKLKTVKAMMEKYLANGAQLGWLIDLDERRVYIYRPNMPVEVGKFHRTPKVDDSFHHKGSKGQRVKARIWFVFFVPLSL